MLLYYAFIVSHLANVVLSLFVVVITIQLFMQTGVRLIVLLSILFTVWAATNVLLLLPQITTVKDIEGLSTLNAMGSAFFPALFILFVDQFEGERSPFKTAIAVATLAVAVFLMVAANVSQYYLITSTIINLPSQGLLTMRWSPLASIAVFPTVFMTALWVYQELSQAIKHSLTHEQVRRIKVMRWGGILTFIIGPVFGIFGVVLVENGALIAGTWASEIIGYSFVSAGVFMFGIAYLQSREIAFLLPQRIESVLVINRSGLPVVKHDFRTDIVQSDFNLVSGAITAITALMSEAFGVSGDIEGIKFQDKELLITFTDKFAFILIAGRRSTYLRDALTRFATTFQDTFSHIKFEKGEVISQTKVLPVINPAFGFNPSPN